MRRITIEERAYARAIDDAVDAKVLARRVPSPYDLTRVRDARRTRDLRGAEQ